MIVNGRGGAFITWTLSSGPYDIYIQHVDMNGNFMWPEGDKVICQSPDSEHSQVLCNNGYQGIFIAWEDTRPATYSDIYAQRIEPNGFFGYYPCPYITAVTDVPNDQGGKILLQWDRSYPDTLPNAEILHYSVWRRLDQIQMQSLGEECKIIDRQVAPIRKDAAGACLITADGYSWEWLADVPARHFENYSLLVESLYDSTGAGTGWQHFMVSAQTDTHHVYYDSPVDSGYSVDNLSPCQVQGLAGEQSYDPEGLMLTWSPNTENDFASYAIYRGTTVEFVPGAGNLVASPQDTAYFDAQWHWSSEFFYKVSAVDVHGNESPFALLRPDDVTGDESPVTPTATFLDQNYPNPFNPQTTIRFGLKKPSHIRLSIYDSSGRLVRVIAEGRWGAGIHHEVWDGRNDMGTAVASGIYFYKLVTGSWERTRKLVLLR
jgi:hypothetical protein